MPLISKPNYNQIFASQAPEQDKPAVFNNYPEGWGPESRPNNGKPTIKGFNYLQQTSDLKDLWILQNGACLPYDESIEYAEGAPVLKDGVIQYKTADGFVNALKTHNSLDGRDVAEAHPASAISDASGVAQQEINDNLKSSVFYHIDHLEDAQKYVGYVVEYNGKHFKVSAEQSKDLRHPVIKSGDAYLIPHDHTTITFNAGGFTSKGQVPNPQDYTKPEIDPVSGRSQQGFVIDNVNKSAFITSCAVNENDLSVKVFEYEFNNGVLGSLKSQGVLSMGHGDYFAITQKDGERHVWFYRPLVGGTHSSGGGHIVAAKWEDGCTDSDIFISIPVADLEPARTVLFYVTNYDEDTICIQGGINYFVDIDALYDAEFLIVDRRDIWWTPTGLEVTVPNQQRNGIVGVQASASGVYSNYRDSTYYAASTRDGSKIAIKNIYINSEEKIELESVGYYWNESSLEFEPTVSLWEIRTGNVYLYNLRSSVKARNSLYGVNNLVSKYTAGQYGAGTLQLLNMPYNIGSNGLYIGGNIHPNLSNTFDKNDFAIEQWAGGHEGRYSAKIVYKNNEIMIDAEDDTALGAGFRFRILGAGQMQIKTGGVNIGTQRNATQEQLARVHAVDPAKPVFYANSEGDARAPSYLSSSTRLDFAVAGASSMKFGRWDVATQTPTQLFYATDTMIRPTVTNGMDLGASAGRWAKGWLNQLNLGDLSEYADNTTAKAGGLVNGDVYRTSTGQLMIVY